MTDPFGSSFDNAFGAGDFGAGGFVDAALEPESATTAAAAADTGNGGRKKGKQSTQRAKKTRSVERSSSLGGGSSVTSESDDEGGDGVATARSWPYVRNRSLFPVLVTPETAYKVGWVLEEVGDGIWKRRWCMLDRPRGHLSLHDSDTADAEATVIITTSVCTVTPVKVSTKLLETAAVQAAGADVPTTVACAAAGTPEPEEPEEQPEPDMSPVEAEPEAGAAEETLATKTEAAKKVLGEQAAAMAGKYQVEEKLQVKERRKSTCGGTVLDDPADPQSGLLLQPSEHPIRLLVNAAALAVLPLERPEPHPGGYLDFVINIFVWALSLPRFAQALSGKADSLMKDMDKKYAIAEKAKALKDNLSKGAEDIDTKYGISKMAADAKARELRVFELTYCNKGTMHCWTACYVAANNGAPPTIFFFYLFRVSSSFQGLTS